MSLEQPSDAAPVAGQPVEATVLINWPLADVYAFYHDLTNLPQFLGDVTQAVRTGPTTYRWTVVGPLGVELHWDVAVVEDKPQQLIRYRTGATGAAFYGEWDVSFTAIGVESTQVHEVLRMPLEWLATKLLALAGKPPQAEVAANLQRLKELLETGRITTLAHVVPGKFGVPAA